MLRLFCRTQAEASFANVPLGLLPALRDPKRDSLTERKPTFLAEMLRLFCQIQLKRASLDFNKKAEHYVLGFLCGERGTIIEHFA